jgi:hypothetical protein
VKESEKLIQQFNKDYKNIRSFITIGYVFAGLFMLVWLGIFAYMIKYIGSVI